MAALFFVIVLAGFIPDSIQKIQAIEAGQRPPLPWFLQIRGVAIGVSSVVFAMMVVMAALLIDISRRVAFVQTARGGAIVLIRKSFVLAF